VSFTASATLQPAVRRRERDLAIVSDDIFVMLLVEAFFKTFAERHLTAKSTEAIVCLVRLPRGGGRAGEEGALRRTTPRATGHGFMYRTATRPSTATSELPRHGPLGRAAPRRDGYAGRRSG
jgi:predicted lactoylglutathione lyase